MKKVVCCVIGLLFLVSCNKKKEHIKPSPNGSVLLNGKEEKVTHSVGVMYQDGKMWFSIILYQQNDQWYDDETGCRNFHFIAGDTISMTQRGKFKLKHPNFSFFGYDDCDVTSCGYGGLDTSYHDYYLDLITLDTAKKTCTYAFSGKFAKTDGRYCNASQQADSMLVQFGPITMPLSVQVVP